MQVFFNKKFLLRFHAHMEKVRPAGSRSGLKGTKQTRHVVDQRIVKIWRQVPETGQ